MRLSGEDERAVLLRNIGSCLHDLHVEGVEQRAIIQAMVACVCDLKVSLDRLTARLETPKKPS